jgi:hypothetical protein
VGPRAGLDDVEKSKFLTLPALELRTLGRPVRSQSLYRLHYPDHISSNINISKHKGRKTESKFTEHGRIRVRSV